MVLYNSQVSGNCYKVRLLLAHLGVAYERREVDVVDRSNFGRPEGGDVPHPHLAGLLRQSRSASADLTAKQPKARRGQGLPRQRRRRRAQPSP